MRLFISVEGQNCTEIGLSKALADIRLALSSISNQNTYVALAKYGSEFTDIALIPTCIDENMWHSLGWKERVLVRRKAHEADVRLKMDYHAFINATDNKKRDLFLEILLESIRRLQQKSKLDFNGDALIADMESAVEKMWHTP